MDERSGRTYWYHKFTRESTWTEPECLKAIRARSDPSAGPLGVILDGVATPQDIIRRLYTNSDMVQMEAIHLISGTLNAETVFEWCSHAEVLSALCFVCSHSSVSSALRLAALKLIWAFTSFPEASSLFVNSSDWKHLVEYLPCWDVESGILLCATIALLSIGPVKTLIQSSVYSFALNWVASSCDIDKSVDGDSLFAPVSNDDDAAHLLSVGTLCLLSDAAQQGSSICAYTLLFISTLAIRGEKSAVQFLRSGGLALVQRLCIGTQVSPAVASKAKTWMLSAMTASSTVRSRLLDCWLDLASSFDEGADRPGSTAIQRVGLLPQKDVLLRARGCSSGWRVNSTLLWTRCLGLRRVLEEFWRQNNWDEHGSHGVPGAAFELELDTTEEVLSCVVDFLHTSLFAPPATTDARMNLVKLVADLEMLALRKLAIECLHNLLKVSSVAEVLAFGRTHRLPDVVRIAEEFSVAGKLPVCRFGSIGDTTMHQNLNLREAIAASLSDVTAILGSSSVPSASTKTAPSKPMMPAGPTYSPDAFNAQERTSSVSTTNTMTGDNLRNKPSVSAKGLKSGGIYKLLLEESDDVTAASYSGTHIGTLAAAPGIRSQDVKMPGRVMGTASNTRPGTSNAKAAPGVGVPARAGPGRKTTSSQQQHEDDAQLVEYSRRMSLAPQKELTANEKRLAEMSKPRNPIQRKHNSLVALSVDGSDLDQETGPDSPDTSTTTKIVSNSHHESDGAGSTTRNTHPKAETAHPTTAQLPRRATSPVIPHKQQQQQQQPQPKEQQRQQQDEQHQPNAALDPVARGSLQLLKTRVVRGRGGVGVRGAKTMSDVDVEASVEKEVPERMSTGLQPTSGSHQPVYAAHQASTHDEYDNEPDEFATQMIPEEGDGNEKLFACPDCNRKFLAEPYQRHVRICAKVFSQSRKVFDSTKMRTAAIMELNDVTDIAPLTGKGKPRAQSRGNNSNVGNAGDVGSNSKPKSRWSEQSNAFREAMKAARDVTKAINSGAPLPPPTLSAPDPSLIPCPHCNRRFNDRAAERHIPMCQSIRAKPTALRKGSGGMTVGTGQTGNRNRSFGK